MKPKYSIATRVLASVKPRKVFCFLAAGLGLFAACHVQAANQTWTSAPADNTWNNVNNWVAKAVPGAINLTGNSINNDLATFTSAIPVSGIGGAANPIMVDNATISGDRSRQIGGILFDTRNCGSYVFSGTTPLVYPGTGILYVTHNNSITINPAVTNNQTFIVPIFVRLPSSTAGVYSFVNNSTSTATLFFAAVTNDSASSRGTVFTLDGSNTGTNTIAALSANTSTNTAANGLTKQGTGTWILSGPNEFRAASLVNINGGTLVVKDPGAFTGVTTPPTITNSTLEIDGVTLTSSTLSLRNGGTIRMNGSATVNGISVGTQAATSVTLATTSSSDVMSVGNAANQPTGGAADTVIHITGPGTVALTQQANYVGKWSIDSGILQLNGGSLGTAGSSLTIGAGATFDVSPLGYYNLTMASLAASGVGTGASAATINAGSGGTFDLATGTKPISLTYTPTSFSGDAAHPALYFSQGNLSLGGNTFTVRNASGTPLGVGTYTLITLAGGSITDGGSYAVVLTGSGLAVGTVGSIQVNGSEVDLVVTAYTPKNLVWSGSANNQWDINADANWLNGATSTVFNNSDKVLFNSVGAANSFVSLVGTLAPGSVTVDTTSASYTFSGSGAIAGPTGLTKTGTGTLNLGTVNTYNGPTIISNGVVQLGTANAIPGNIGGSDVTVLSAGTLDLNGQNDTINALTGNGTVDDVSGGGNPVLTIGNNGDSGVFSGVIKSTSGTLGITMAGNGTETLAGNNSYSGPTTINAGTLLVKNVNALGAGNSAVSVNAGNLDLGTSVLVGSFGGTGGAVLNNTSATTNSLIVTNGGTVNALISDGSGGGAVKLAITGGTLRLNAANTYSGGTIISAGAGLAFGSGPANAGPGMIIASNNVTLSMPNNGSSFSAPNSPITTVAGATVTFTSRTTANNWSGQFFGGATANNVFSGGNMTIGGAMSFSNFFGTVVFTNGGPRWGANGGTLGGDNTTFYLDASGGCYARDSLCTVHLGALTGSGGIGNPQMTFPATYWIGAKGNNTEFSGSITGSNNIVKTGAGRLTLDGAPYTVQTDGSTYSNFLYSGSAITYVNNTTISNGVLALSCPNNLQDSPNITLTGSNSVLDASNMGYITNFNDANSNPDSALVTNGLFELVGASPANGTPQTLSGVGTITGKLLVDNGATLNPGLPTGTLTVSGAVELAGTVTLAINRTNAAANSELAASAITVDPTATLVITNLGPSIVDGTTFPLFSKPVSGFSSVVLPATDPTGTTNYVWNNNLAVNGSITLVSGGLTVATNPTNITVSVSNGTLTLTWPGDHLSWYLQAQTNTVGKGLGTNWVDVPGSSRVTSYSFLINKTNPAVFYRMSLNP